MVTVHHNIAAAATMHKAFVLALVVALVLFPEAGADSIQRIHRKHHQIQQPFYQARAQQDNFYFNDDYGDFGNAYDEDFEDDFALEGDYENFDDGYEIAEYDDYSDADFDDAFEVDYNDFDDAYSDQSDAYDAADEYYDFDYNELNGDDDNSDAYAADEYYDDAQFESESADESVSSARVVVSKEGPPPP